MLKRLLICAGLLGCLQLCCYRMASMSAALDGHFPSPQPDTRLYCQAAKRICQGQAFSYSVGEPRSTGTTSVLYPFVLAVPYRFGATGDRLLEAGFWLNGGFYLLFLIGWTLAFFRWIEGGCCKWLAVILLSLSGQPAICAFSQSDTGFWMAASGLLAAAVSWNRWYVATVLVALGPWIRPEGMFVVVAMLAMAVGFRSWRRRLMLPAIVGIVSSLSVFCLNHWLTGRFQFDSLANKGYFNSLPFSTACIGTIHDAYILFRAYFVGLDENWPRMVFSIPIVGGALLWLGIFTRRWNVRRDVPLACVGLAMLISLAVLSTSRQLGQNFERYLAWISPLFLLFTATGTVWCGRIASLRRLCWMPSVLVIFFYLGIGVSCVLFFHSTSKKESVADEYYRAAECAMAAEDMRVNRNSPGRVGGLSCAGVYDYSGRQFRNLSGIYSPEFFEYYQPATFVELLKHRRDLRFEYWQTYGMADNADIPRLDEVLGPVLLAGPEGFGIRCADWSAFDRAAELPDAPEGTSLKARVDVGYLPDEKQAEYDVLDRWGRDPPPIVSAVANLNGLSAIDSGRVVVGGDAMTVDLTPERDCYVTVRALSKKDGLTVQNTVKLLIQIDGEDANVVTLDIDDKPDEFQDRTVVVPGRFIHRRPSRIALLGDHIVCGYWFWQ